MVHIRLPRGRDRCDTTNREPTQERSKRSLERILVATEELLDTELFADATMVRIARRAAVAVGTLYLRFPSKDALLPVLLERYEATLYK